MQSFAKKIGTTHYYSEKGTHKIATVLELLETIACGTKSEEKDGYTAHIYALTTTKGSKSKSLAGQFKKVENIKKLKEEKIESSNEGFEIGKAVKASDFSEGDSITIYGISKGKGFAGTVKRHSFNTGPKTHGSHNYRQPGSIGDTGPQHVVKGKKMAGHMGSTNAKIKGVKIAKVDEKRNTIWVNSPVPGPNKSLILIQK